MEEEILHQQQPQIYTLEQQILIMSMVVEKVQMQQQQPHRL